MIRLSDTTYQHVELLYNHLFPTEVAHIAQKHKEFSVNTVKRINLTNANYNTTSAAFMEKSYPITPKLVLKRVWMCKTTTFIALLH